MLQIEMPFTRKIFLLAAGSFFAVASSFAQVKVDSNAHKLSELYSPVPKIVTPGNTVGDAPSDAEILFDGKNLDKWASAKDAKDSGNAATWEIVNGDLLVSKTAGNIQTRDTFMDYQLHLEFKIPASITGSDQARGNSGIFLASRGTGDAGYELQILDNYNNATYTNGQVGAIYKQAFPLANPCKKPGEWSVYDIVWTAPRFREDGSVLTRARATVFLNGVLVENNFELWGQTVYVGSPFYKKHGASPIKLQAHGDKSEPISFRNIWVRKI